MLALDNSNYYEFEYIRKEAEIKQFQAIYFACDFVGQEVGKGLGKAGVSPVGRVQCCWLGLQSCVVWTSKMACSHGWERGKNLIYPWEVE